MGSLSWNSLFLLSFHIFHFTSNVNEKASWRFVISEYIRHMEVNISVDFIQLQRWQLPFSAWDNYTSGNVDSQCSSSFCFEYKCMMFLGRCFQMSAPLRTLTRSLILVVRERGVLDLIIFCWANLLLLLFTWFPTQQFNKKGSVEFCVFSPMLCVWDDEKWGRRKQLLSSFTSVVLFEYFVQCRSTS